MLMSQRPFVKALRQNMTDAERLFWKHLRAHRLSGHKFRRQQPIGPYVVDFVHFGARLIIECDGGQHNESADDQRRDVWLSQQGFRVLRFWNHDIMNETESVITEIFTALTPLYPRGRGVGGEGENQGEKE
jgi:very-short-patch-repair endonuclease